MTERVNGKHWPFEAQARAMCREVFHRENPEYPAHSDACACDMAWKLSTYSDVVPFAWRRFILRRPRSMDAFWYPQKDADGWIIDDGEPGVGRLAPNSTILTDQPKWHVGYSYATLAAMPIGCSIQGVYFSAPINGHRQFDIIRVE